jgi:hypothetical protein
MITNRSAREVVARRPRWMMGICVELYILDGPGFDGWMLFKAA